MIIELVLKVSFGDTGRQIAEQKLDSFYFKFCGALNDWLIGLQLYNLIDPEVFRVNAPFNYAVDEPEVFYSRLFLIN
jgi:hypothetical protein